MSTAIPTVWESPFSNAYERTLRGSSPSLMSRTTGRAPARRMRSAAPGGRIPLGALGIAVGARAAFPTTALAEGPGGPEEATADDDGASTAVIAESSGDGGASRPALPRTDALSTAGATDGVPPP